MAREPSRTPADLELSAIVDGRYQLLRRIARGGVGEVHAARDLSTGATVALKRLQPGAREHSGQVACFMREYHALSELRHPRIIQVFDYGIDAQGPYYTMELLAGQDLRDLAPISYRDACSYLRDVASSLALLHARRLLHRDISPRNVRRTDDGHVKLLDFGAMVPFGVPPNVAGTPPCIAPEALQGGVLDQRADLYSLGALAYCVLTGRYAHEVSTIEELPSALRRRIKRPKQLLPGLPDSLDQLIMALLNPDPMKRPKSAAEVSDWLSAAGQLQPDDAGAAAMSFMTGTLLCGRSQHTRQLEQHLKRAAAGQGGALLIQGPAGAGKSRLLSEAVVLAQTSGMSVVHAVARAQRGANHWLVHDLLSALIQVAPREAERAGAARIEWGGGATPARGQELATRDGFAEARSELQQALGQVFRAVAQARPLMLAIDDIDRADELSIAQLASLARQSDNLPLLLVCTRTLDQSVSDAALLWLLSSARPVEVGPLNVLHTGQLVSSIFGNIPNLGAVTEFIHRGSQGNPRLIVELAEHWVRSGTARYVEGSWHLADEALDNEVPTTLRQAWGVRLLGLDSDALGLAELLSLRRGGASVELCLAVAQELIPDVLGALQRLVQRGVLESAGEEYVFAHASLQTTLQQGLSAERRRQLHDRWASALDARASRSQAQTLELGWHQVCGTDEVRGAKLLAEVAPSLVEQGWAMDLAISALEQALEIYERRGLPLDERMRLRATLVLAGYLYDYRLAHRYGESTLELLYELSGTALASRLSSRIPATLAMPLSLAAVWLRRWFVPRTQRSPAVIVALQYFIRSAMGLLGVYAIALDAAAARRILALMEPLDALPRFTSGRAIYLACRAFATQVSGREGALARELSAALAELGRGRHFDMSEYEYSQLMVGLAMADGAQECLREGSRALERADALANLGGPLAAAAAERVRMLFYLRSGDLERADRARAALDALAIAGGTAWQVDWFSLPAEAMAGVVWSDLLLTRRSLERLERLVPNVPGLAPHLLTVRAGYHFLRGEYAQTVACATRYVEQYPPATLVGWGWLYSLYAFALLELGHTEQARVVSEQAQAQLTEDDRAYEWMYTPLEVAYATALALSGERERAETLVRSRIDRMLELQEHAELVALHAQVVRMYRLLGDASKLAGALQDMRALALRSGLPAVLLLADRTHEAHAPPRSSPLPPPRALDTVTSRGRRNTADATATAIGAFLKNREGSATRSRDVLSVLLRWIGESEGHLFMMRGGNPALIISLGSELVPEALTQHAKRVLATGSHAAGTVSRIELDPESSADAGRSAVGACKRYRLLLLRSSRSRRLVLVALRDEADAAVEIPEALITDVERALRGESTDASFR